ncbi:MAG: hypothetical protein AAF327_20740, partial [Cyanobacteria bacterium P01_A01_bin.37]
VRTAIGDRSPKGQRSEGRWHRNSLNQHSFPTLISSSSLRTTSREHLIVSDAARYPESVAAK